MPPRSKDPLKVGRLGEKLKAIRLALGLSQNEIISRLKTGDPRLSRIMREEISNYERDLREPPLPLLLQYARIAGISTDVLIDDKANLPETLPTARASKTKH